MTNMNKSKKGILIIAGAIVAVLVALAVLLAIIIGILIFFGGSRSVEEGTLSEDVTMNSDSDETLVSTDTKISSKDTIATDSSSAVSEDLSMQSEYNDMYAGLLVGDVTYEELEFVLSVVEKMRTEQGTSLLSCAFSMIIAQPSLQGVYEPIEGTSSSYDAEHLDRILSPVTIVRISESTIPEFAELKDGVLTLHQEIESGESRYCATISKFYFDENGYLCVEYGFSHSSEDGTIRMGNAVCKFAQNEEGKYFFWSATEL